MRFKVNKRNILFIVLIAVLIIPQSRHQIQLLLHKGISYVNQSTIIEEEDRLNVDLKNWRLVSDQGDIVNLGEIRNQVIVINFWATWCPPCIVEMPSLQKLYDEYNEEVVFLFVTNDALDVVDKFRNKNGYTFKVYNSTNEIPKELMTSSIPRTFIINKNSEIVADEKGAVDWYSSNVKEQLTSLIEQ